MIPKHYTAPLYWADDRTYKEVSFGGEDAGFNQLTLISGMAVTERSMVSFFKEYETQNDGETFLHRAMSKDGDLILFFWSSIPNIHYSEHKEFLEYWLYHIDPMVQNEEKNKTQVIIFAHDWETFTLFKEVLESDKYKHLQERFTYLRFSFNWEDKNKVEIMPYSFDLFSSAIERNWEIR